MTDSDALWAKPGPEPMARRVHGSGDAWVLGPDGRRFWGTFGAAGLLVVHPSAGILLQHRVEWSHFGGTWGLPGGARHEHESAAQGAIREAEEEAGVPGEALRLRFGSVLDLGWWSYTTIVADVAELFTPVVGDAESLELRWVPVDEVDTLPLHPGFAQRWPSLRTDLATRHRLIVDAANVVGSRPDGWWRDRAGATDRLVRELAVALARGLPASLLGAPHDTWWPEVTVVVEGQARAMGADLPGIRIVRAPRDGDATVVSEVAEDVAAGIAAETAAASGSVTVVTADRGLRERVGALGARVVSPGRLLDVLADQS